MAQAVEAYRSVSATEEFRQLERLRADTRHNEAAALGNARREGMREGEYKKAVEFAKKALDQGLSADIVAQITGLTVDEVLRLQQ
jgi:predicted transposase/invertase (TIGR01784 family)